MAAASAAEYQVLEFELDGSAYCVDLASVDEIVNTDSTITQIPNAPPEVVGVMDLRGRTTTVIDPRIQLGIDTDQQTKYVIVFDTEDTEPTGWLIEDVTQVATMAGDQLDESIAEGSVKGVFKDDDSFTIWVEPAVT